MLAWHHDHLVYQTQSKQKRYHQHERAERLAVAEGLLGEEFESLRAWVFDRLDSVIRASSLVERVNSLVRPYLHSCKGPITQETLNLILFYHNHHRYQSGKRKGKAPLELLTGQSLPGEWWERLIQPVQEAEKDPKPVNHPSTPPLPLRDHPEESTDPPTESPNPEHWEATLASEKEHPPAAQAA